MNAFVERPRLPEHLRAPIGASGLVFCAYSLLLFLLPTALNILVYEEVESLPLKIALLVPLWLLSQQGLHLLGMAGHEGLHGNLHSNRLLSIYLGLLFSSMVLGYLVAGYYVSHWQHHLFTNTEADPDVQACSRFKNYWSRCLLSRLYLTGLYRKATFRLAFGQEFPDDRLPYGLAKMRTFAKLNLYYQALWIAVYAVFGVFQPMWLLVGVAMSYLLTIVGSGLRVYVEHAGTDGEPGRIARSFSSTFWTIANAKRPTSSPATARSSNTDSPATRIRWATGGQRTERDLTGSDRSADGGQRRSRTAHLSRTCHSSSSVRRGHCLAAPSEALYRPKSSFWRPLSTAIPGTPECYGFQEAPLPIPTSMPSKPVIQGLVRPVRASRVLPLADWSRRAGRGSHPSRDRALPAGGERRPTMTKDQKVIRREGGVAGIGQAARQCQPSLQDDGLQPRQLLPVQGDV
jgi:beta-carotene hydroxylase